MIAAKTPESMEKFAPKILEKNSFQWGIYRPQKNIAVGSRNARNTLPVDRSGRPSNGQFLPVGSYRSTAPVDPNKQRALLSSRSTRAVGRHSVSKRAQICARRSTDPVDRLQAKSTCQKTSRLVEAWNRKNSLKIF